MATFQESVAVRNASNDAKEVTIGTAPKLRFYTGAIPANCAAARTGTLIAEGSLPSDWMNASAAGVKGKLGTWTVTGLPAAGAGANVGYFSITDTAGTTVHQQGDVTATGGGGAMTVDNISVANAQAVNVNTYDITAGNA
jgi:hypothetical protein